MTAAIDIGTQLAAAHRFCFLKDILDGFSEGIDYDRMEAGLFWAYHGLVQPEPPAALISLFAAPHLAAEEVGEWEGDAQAEGTKDLYRLDAEALFMAGLGQNIRTHIDRTADCSTSDRERVHRIVEDGRALRTRLDAGAPQ